MLKYNIGIKAYFPIYSLNKRTDICIDIFDIAIDNSWIKWKELYNKHWLIYPM